MKEEILGMLACPFHPEEKLDYLESEKKFICEVCHREFNVIEHQGIEIPNFLTDDNNWKRGYREVKGDLIKKFQGKPFKSKLDKSKFVLDVGCGDTPRGNINVDCYIPDRIPENFILASAEYLPFRENSVDVVVNNYVIEHLVNPSAFIQNTCKIAKEKVVIITDNSEWIGDIFFRIYGAGRIFNDEHNYKWSVEYLENLIKRLGYKKNRVYLLNLSSNPLVKITSALGKIPRLGNFFLRDLKAVIYKK